MYVRPPVQSKENIKIPENYSGSAFSSAQYRPRPNNSRDLPHEEYLQKEYIKRPPEQKSSYTPEKSYNEKPSAAHYGAALGQSSISEEIFEIQSQSQTESDVVPDVIEMRKSETEQKRPSLLSSVFPPELLKNNFPFGHGIGSEELLILAMMFLVFNSSEDGREPDTELIMLLALLLFAG